MFAQERIYYHCQSHKAIKCSGERSISINTVVLRAICLCTILMLLLAPEGWFSVAAFFKIKRRYLGSSKLKTKPPCGLFVLESVSIFTDLL